MKADMTGQHKGSTSKALFTTTTDAYCVAQFFIYYAEDLERWVYGINRYSSSSNVAAGLVDVPNYDGVKAFQYSIARATGDAVYGRKYDEDATTFGANPAFKQRGKYYGTCSAASRTEDLTKCGNDSDHIAGDIKGPGIAAADASKDGDCPVATTGVKTICGSDRKVDCIFYGTATDACTGATGRATSGNTFTQQKFMGDGREDDSATTLSTVSVQAQKYTRCLVCHGSQEFTIPQAQSSGKISKVSE